MRQYFGNQGGGPTDFSPSTNKSKLARLWAFPDIVGRDAPGKTGSAAKPALVYLIEPKLAQDYDYPSQVVVRLGVWNSTGTGFVGSGPFNLTKSPEFVTPPNIFSMPNMGQAFFPTPRRVFSGVQYYIGHYVQSPATLTVSPPTYYYYQVSPDTARVAFDTTPATSSVNFSKDGDLLNQDLGHLIYYDVLPSQPLSLSATISGSLDLDIALSWTAPEFNGAGEYSTIEVTGYRIQRSTNNGATWTTVVPNSATTATTFTDINLAPGTTYTYRVAAINPVATSHGADYSGPYSLTAVATIPDAEPGNALSLLTATVANPEPLPLVFSDFGPGIRFTEIAVQYGAEYLYTRVEATTQDSFAELQVADAPESQERYGIRTYSVTGLLNSEDQGAFEVAKDLLTYYYQPELRLESVTVDLANLSLAEKLQVLSLEIDGYISVVFTPNGIGDPKISTGLVTSISHQITLTSHKVELRLRNERTLYTLDSDSKGILNVNILGP
jgi:hypothetical protein